MHATEISISICRATHCPVIDSRSPCKSCPVSRAQKLFFLTLCLFMSVLHSPDHPTANFHIKSATQITKYFLAKTEPSLPAAKEQL